MQGKSVDIWKENVMEDLKSRSLSYTTAKEFLSDLKEGFGREDDKIMKVAELKKVKQGNKTIEEFVQEFRRVARGSEYKRRLLVEEFKREMNGITRRKLIEVERPSGSIEQQYKRATNLDRHWREIM